MEDFNIEESIKNEKLMEDLKGILESFMDYVRNASDQEIINLGTFLYMKKTGRLN